MPFLELSTMLRVAVVGVNALEQIAAEAIRYTVRFHNTRPEFLPTLRVFCRLSVLFGYR